VWYYFISIDESSFQDLRSCGAPFFLLAMLLRAFSLYASFAFFYAHLTFFSFLLDSTYHLSITLRILGLLLI
jgi:hypothetical protein